MQIVIDIPEEMYQKIKETSMVISGRRSGKRFDYILFKAVNTGTPLPKGHGRLIDADELKKIIQENDVLNMTGFNVRLCDINNTPTIIEADKE